MRHWRLIACAALAPVQISKRAGWESGARRVRRDGTKMGLRRCVTAPANELRSYSLCEVLFFACFSLMLGFGSQGLFPPSPRGRSDTGQSPKGWEKLRDPHTTQPVAHSYTNTRWQRSHLGKASINYDRINQRRSGTKEPLNQSRVFKRRNITNELLEMTDRFHLPNMKGVSRQQQEGKRKIH